MIKVSHSPVAPTDCHKLSHSTSEQIARKRWQQAKNKQIKSKP